MRRFSTGLVGLVAVGTALSAAVALAQPPVARPQSPPAAGTTAQPAQPQPKPGTVKPPQSAVAPPATAAAPARPAADAPPSAAELGGVPIYPGATYLGSYDAGRGQRFYLYGSQQPYAELVGYYRTVLKDKGELVFDAPATHQFDVGKFKDTDVDFTPGVSIKDYTWGGSQGYLNPKPGGAPAAFPTVIQVVSPPAGMAGRPR